MGFQTQYGHLKASLVQVGDSVERGQPIAEVGNTGKSTGPHLHYEVRQFGIPIDPMQYMID
jgi:murein DD-endopeptidase MepM/ murein hydrolase activator NlpD